MRESGPISYEATPSASFQQGVTGMAEFSQVHELVGGCGKGGLGDARCFGRECIVGARAGWQVGSTALGFGPWCAAGVWCFAVFQGYLEYTNQHTRLSGG